MTLTQELVKGHTRPRAPDVVVENIPEELRRYDHWLCWRYELDKGKWKKPPLDCRTGWKADKTDPKVWVPFKAALAYYRRHDDVDGIGFAFTPEGPFSGIDLDDCRDPQTGHFHPEAERIIRALDSYGEVSPSETGGKLFVRGKLPPGSRTRTNDVPWGGGIEMYSSACYFTVTGLHLPQTPRTIEDRQDVLLQLYGRIFGQQGQTQSTQATSTRTPQQPVGAGEPQVAEVLARAMRAGNGEKFARLWAGDTTGYPSPSEADLALCRLLAFWVGPDPLQIEQLFAQSALGRREKWLDREDYRKTTIRTAIEGQTEVYRAQEPTVIDRPNEAPDDPHRLARLFVDEQCRHPDGRTLHYWRDEWHRWNGRTYRAVPEKEVRANLCAAIKDEFDRVNLRELKDHERRRKEAGLRRGKEPPTACKVTQALVGNVLQALSGMTVLPDAIEQPAWLGGDGPFPADEVLVAANGLVHLPALEFRPPTPRFFSPNVLDYDFDPTAAEPRAWLHFLHQLWPDDPHSIETLQDWFGYCLLPDTRQQKMLLLVGPKRSGKGTIARVLKGLVGEANVAGPTLSSLATSFGLWPLLGKTVAVVSDARLSGRTDATVITERLLSISGEDTLTVDRKHLPPVHVKLAARFLVLTNELPRVNDASGALAGRMLLLRLTQSFYGQEDPDLTARLLEELPRILLWAVEGWRRLRERRHFLQPASGRELLGHLEDLGSPIGAFIRECCVVEQDQQVPKADLYGRWTAWCQTGGREHPGDTATFGRNLLAAVPTVRTAQPRDGGKRTPTYAGIGLARA